MKYSKIVILSTITPFLRVNVSMANDRGENFPLSLAGPEESNNISRRCNGWKSRPRPGCLPPDGGNGSEFFLTAHSLKIAWAAAEGLPNTEPWELDVTRPKSTPIAARAIRENAARLDILINNAGVLDWSDPWNGSRLDLEPAVLRDTMETNVLGVLNVCRAFMPLMNETGGGRVVNISSGAGSLEGMGSGAGAYKASKAALNALRRLLAPDFQGSDMLVNGVGPGWCRTDMGGGEGPRTAEQGAESVLWAATLPAGGPTGGFFREGERVP